MRVAVCGPAVCTDDEARTAFAVGRHLARRGATVLCGGGPGVMASVAAGAGSLQGLVVAIRPGRDPGHGFPDVTVVISTDLGEARNAVMVATADAVIAVGGSWGTMSEVAFAMRRARDEPTFVVVNLGGWRVVDAAGTPIGGMLEARDAEHAVALALGLT